MDIEEYEKALLGLMLTNTGEAQTLVHELEQDDFKRHEHGVVFIAIRDGLEADGSADFRTVSDRIDKESLTVKHSDIADMLINPLLAVHRPAYVKRILEESESRHRQRVLLTAAHDDSDADEIIERIRKGLKRKAARNGYEGFTGISEGMDEVESQLQDAMLSEREFMGLDTGFRELNHKLNGLCGSELTVIGARPSIGKTTFALQLIRSAVSECGVGFFSLEMSCLQVYQRLVCMEAYIPLHMFRRGKLTEAELDNYKTHSEVVRELPIFVDDTAGISLPRARSRMEKIAKEHDIGLWVFDYLQLMSSVGANENEQVNNISRGLKEFSKDFDQPIVVLSQLNRSVEARGDKRPQMSDMRGSGGIEQDADNVLMLYRPGFYPQLYNGWKGPGDIAQYVEVLCEKTRFGPTGTLLLAWNPETATFRDKRMM